MATIPINLIYTRIIYLPLFHSTIIVVLSKVIIQIMNSWHLNQYNLILIILLKILSTFWTIHENRLNSRSFFSYCHAHQACCSTKEKYILILISLFILMFLLLLTQPTAIWLWLPICQLTVANFINDVPVAESNRQVSFLSSLIFPQLHSLELSSLFYPCLPQYRILVAFLLLSWPPMSTPPLNVDIPQWCVYNLFSWLHTLSPSFHYHLYANDLQMEASHSCLSPKLYASLSIWQTPWIYHKYHKINVSETKLLIQFSNAFFSKVLCLYNSTTSYKLETLEAIFLLPYPTHSNHYQELPVPFPKYL